MAETDKIALQKETFCGIVKDKIHRKGIDDLMAFIESSDFFVAPASTRFHGAYEGALCEHSMNVYNQLVKLANEHCPGEYVDETLAIVGLFHDVCKIHCYKKSKKNVKNLDTGKWETVDCYEFDEQVPLGHGEKSCILLQQYMKLTIPELYAIRWHMSGYDNAVRGGELGSGKAADKCHLVTLIQLADSTSAHILEGVN